MSDDLTPAQHAAAIDEARQQLIGFVQRCTDAQWQSSPVDGDPRSVGVIADHVADAYEYLADWITDLVEGESPEVNPDIVDELNAEHAEGIDEITPAEVLEHLQSSGDDLIDLVSELDSSQLTLGDGQVARLASVAARHATSHREEIEAALALVS